MNQQEISLIEKTKEGDILSFEKLIEPYQKRAFNIAYRMLGNMEDANDITQEALIKIYKSINQFEGKSSFSTWIYSIVSNTCIDFLRKKKKTQTLYLEQLNTADKKNYQVELPDEVNTPEYLLERKEMQNIIQDAINQLKEDHKEIIILRDINGFSYQEIADILKCSEGTVKSRISRARGNLKILLSSKMQEA